MRCASVGHKRVKTTSLLPLTQPLRQLLYLLFNPRHDQKSGRAPPCSLTRMTTIFPRRPPSRRRSLRHRPNGLLSQKVCPFDLASPCLVLYVVSNSLLHDTRTYPRPLHDRRVEPGIGALCWKCNKTVPKQPRVKAAPRSRVSTSKSASSIGAVIDGAIELPTLQHICIQVRYLPTYRQIVAEHIHQVKALDQLRESSMHNLSRVRPSILTSQVISKNRSLTPATLPLFLSPTIRELRLFDCSGTCSAN